MSRLLAFPAGRRDKWIVLAGAFVVLFVAGSFAGKFEDVQKNEPVSYLPGNAESVKALKQLEDFPSDRPAPAFRPDADRLEEPEPAGAGASS